MRDTITSEYLGNSVYARFDGDHVWIWVHDKWGRGREVVLEPSVFRALVRFYKVCHSMDDDSN